MAVSKEDRRLTELDNQMKRKQETLEAMLMIWCTVDRKKRTLEMEIQILKDEREKLTQGQLVFDGTVQF